MPSTNTPDVPLQDSKKVQLVTPPTTAQLVDDEAPRLEISNANINGIEEPGAKNKTSTEPQDRVDGTTDTTSGIVGQGQVPASLSAPEQMSSAPVETAESVTPSAFSEPQARGAMKDEEKDKDGDKPENGSLSPTLTGIHPKKRTSYHKANKSSTSSSGNGQPKSPSIKRTPKSSFLSKLFRKLVPCIGPSSRFHPIELDDTASGTSEPLHAPKEKTVTKGPEHIVLESEPPPAPPKDPASSPPERLKTNEASTSALTAPLPSLTVPPKLADDAEVILPPTPTTHLLPKSETEGVTSGAVQPPGSTGGGSVLQDRTHSRDSTVPSHSGGDGDESEGTSFTEDEDMDDPNNLDEAEDEEDRLILNGGAGIPIGPDGIPKPLLPPVAPQHAGRKCLVLDLDETLVHSSFKSIQQADYVVPVEIEYHWHNVYVIKRPGVDNFLKKMGEIYEVVVFTASLSKYADPVLDKLDIHQVVTHRLFRESCYNHKGNYVKDLSQLGRPTADTIILDNSPASYIFHPNNAVPVSSWFNDPHDTELTDLVPFLADMSAVDDVRGVLDGAR